MFRKLLGLLRERGYSQSQWASAIGISRPSLSARLNGTQPFKLNEIYATVSFLEIPREEIVTYFFDEECRNLHQEEVR